MKKLFTKIVAGASAVATFTMLATPAFAQSYYDYGYTTAGSAADAAAFGISWLFICLCACLPYLLFLGLAYWVYKDAQKNNVDNAALWAVLTFLFPLIGILVYILVAKADAKKKSTPASTEKKE